MTTDHDLLAKIIGDDAEPLKIETVRAWQSALRAVVELHKPDGKGLCFQCDEVQVSSEGFLYPCPTIQAIEKELG